MIYKDPQCQSKKKKYISYKKKKFNIGKLLIAQSLKMIKQSKRPLILIGMALNFQRRLN